MRAADKKEVYELIIKAFQNHTESNEIKELKKEIEKLKSQSLNREGNYNSLHKKVQIFCESCSRHDLCSEAAKDARTWNLDKPEIHCAFYDHVYFTND